jgi:hypothetical protein
MLLRAILRFVEKVGYDDNVVRRSPLVPSVEGDDLAVVVQVIVHGYSSSHPI